MKPKKHKITVEAAATPSASVAADLFCGAGGLSFGFQQAGFQIAFANDINERTPIRIVSTTMGRTQFFVSP